MTKQKNFSNQDTPSIIDTEYRNCNFAHTNPFQDGSGWKGNRLFPSDDTPRTFINCNLTNCEPPPGSTVENCNCTIVRPKVLQFSEDITIDGQSETINHYKRIAYGKWTPSGYSYFQTPKEREFQEDD